MILDVNILLYAVDSTSPDHEKARAWLARALTGSRRVGFPWQTIGGFLRIATHPRVFDRPLTSAQAWQLLDGWLASPVAWIPEAGPRSVAVLRELTRDQRTSGASFSDAQLAALAIEHGVPMISADRDFQRFPGLVWINPLSGDF